MSNYMVSVVLSETDSVERALKKLRQSRQASPPAHPTVEPRLNRSSQRCRWSERTPAADLRAVKRNDPLGAAPYSSSRLLKKYSRAAKGGTTTS
jgi:hypothetical protein